MATALTSPRPLEGLRVVAKRLAGRAAALWRAYPRETLALALFALVATVALAVKLLPGVSPARQLQTAPPAPPPMLVRPLAPEQAVKLNAAIPLSTGPNPAAAPFVLKGNAAAR